MSAPAPFWESVVIRVMAVQAISLAVAIVGASNNWPTETFLWILVLDFVLTVLLEIFFQSRQRKKDALIEARVAQLEQRILAGLPEGAPSLDSATKQGLAPALERVVRDADRGGMTAERIVERGDAGSVVDYLAANRAKLVAAKNALDDKVRKDLIQRDREIGAAAYVAGRIPEAETAAKRILVDLPDDVAALNLLGLILRMRGEFQDAANVFSRVVAIASSKLNRAGALNNLGSAYALGGELEHGLKHFQAAFELYSRLGDRGGMSLAMGNQANIALARGKPKEARPILEDAVRAYRELEDPEGLSIQLNNLGGVLFRLDDLEGAESLHKESLGICESIGYKEGIAASVANLAAISLTRGQLPEAEAGFSRALALNRELGRKQGVAMMLGNLGTIRERLGDLPGAKEAHEEALALDETIKRQDGIANHCMNLGILCEKLGDHDSARNYWERAALLYDEMGNEPRANAARDYLRDLGSLPSAEDGDRGGG